MRTFSVPDMDSPFSPDSSDPISEVDTHVLDLLPPPTPMDLMDFDLGFLDAVDPVINDLNQPWTLNTCIQNLDVQISALTIYLETMRAENVEIITDLKQTLTQNLTILFLELGSISSKIDKIQEEIRSSSQLTANCAATAEACELQKVHITNLEAANQQLSRQYNELRIQADEKSRTKDIELNASESLAKAFQAMALALTRENEELKTKNAPKNEIVTKTGPHKITWGGVVDISDEE